MKSSKYLSIIIILFGVFTFCHQHVIAAPPDWTPVPSLQYNMQVVAVLQYSGGSTSTNSSDIVAAFVGTECRGVASPFSNGFIFLTIGSNVISGEQITFKAYLASLDLVVDLDQSFSFSNQQQVGDPGEPFVFSYTVQNPVLYTSTASLYFGTIQSGSCSTLNYQLTGNNLIANVIISAPSAFEVSTQPASGFAGSISIPVTSGAVNQTIYVKFCPTAAQSYSGNIINASTGASTVNVSVSGAGTAECDPGWIPQSNLQYNMQFIGQMQFDGQMSNNTNDIVGAFVGGQCRGIASPLGADGLLFLTVGSNTASGEQITFRLWNSESCQECNSPSEITFENQALIGNPGEPYIFSCEAQLPELIVDPVLIAFGNVVLGNCATFNYLLTGSNLTANVTITALTGFQVSMIENTGFANQISVPQSSGVVNQTIFVRFCPALAQSYSGNITNASTGASTVNVSVTGTGQYPPLPTIYNVGGGGSYCAGTSPTGISVTLSSSQPGITYQLKKNGVPSGSLISGTGSSLSWLNQTAGTYDVEASNGYQSIMMAGSAVVIETPLSPVNVTIQASDNNVCAGTQVGFIATPTNGGSNPAYQWKVNGNNVGGNSASYSYIPANNDMVSVVLTSNANCTSGNPATSNAIAMIVNPLLQVSISIQASANNVCAGTQVGFIATPTNGGSNPAYQWKVNGNNVSGNSASYSYIPANNDVVSVVLTSNASCTSGNPATSNAITMIVNPLLPVSISIQASVNNVCAGTQVGFIATPTNGGNNPAYQWKVNGNNVSGNSASYSYIPANNDVVSVVLTSNASCTSGNPATSNAITMIVNPLPVVTWEAFDPDTLCIFWEPVALTGGFPSGGIYSGIGVTNNYFDPSLAGYGSKTLLYTFTNQFNCSANASFEVFVDYCTALPELSADELRIRLYPNPAKGIITIEFNDPNLIVSDYAVYDIYGQLIMKRKESLCNKSAIQFGQVPKGVYVLKLRFGKEEHPILFLVQ
ncbi:MAG: hypothetical protein CVT92_15165 [Bacteroidetes bacterium HGW-Bacteroidetes-1]|jgi:hypothetical protein|nr:MAG: hypothetical protein CVT92_15165 [Bacteroidetes bacterium HGW-Bacteroidetes-1]